MKRLTFLLLITPLAMQCSPSVSMSRYFELADSFMKTYVNTAGMVDYSRVKKEIARWPELTTALREADLKSVKNKDEVKAFWINAYNLSVIIYVSELFPIKSPLDSKGFFDAKKFRIAGQDLTLNDMEKKKLIEPFKDPRFHFALVCAAKGCPKLRNRAYLPANLDGQLDTQTKSVLNDRDFIRVSSDGKSVQISEIFDWYKADFLSKAKSVVDYINRYRATNPIPANFTFYQYDWSLNVQ